MYGNSAKCIMDEMDFHLIATPKEKTDKEYFKDGRTCVSRSTTRALWVVR